MSHSVKRVLWCRWGGERETLQGNLSRFGKACSFSQSWDAPVVTCLRIDSALCFCQGCRPDTPLGAYLPYVSSYAPLARFSTDFLPSSPRPPSPIKGEGGSEPKGFFRVLKPLSPGGRGVGVRRRKCEKKDRMIPYLDTYGRTSPNPRNPTGFGHHFSRWFLFRSKLALVAVCLLGGNLVLGCLLLSHPRSSCGADLGFYSRRGLCVCPSYCDGRNVARNVSILYEGVVRRFGGSFPIDHSP